MSDRQEKHTLEHRAWNELKEVWLMVEGLDGLEPLSTNGEEEVRDTFLIPSACDWCGESASSGYFVAIEEERYGVCAICWGRSPSYVEFRREGLPHLEAYRKLVGPEETALND